MLKKCTLILLILVCLSPFVHARDFFKIPDCAWQRKIGDLPVKCVSSCPNRGIALGGFGAGAFMYSITGSFGPWAMEVAEYDEYWSPSAAFHVYEKKGNTVTVKCLSALESMKPAWDRIKKGDGTYYALQPFGWTTYNCFSSDISSKFFSPIIANNYKETSYPVAVWEWRVSNPTKEKIDVAIMFTWPNEERFNLQKRLGLTNTMKTAGGATGIVMKAFHKKNTPETQNSEWCIAVRGDCTYATSWNEDGDGSDIWTDFKDDGMLGNKALDTSNTASAVAVKVSLAPGEVKVIPVVLAWDFPVVKFTKAEWWKKYCMYFGRDSDNSFDIASEALNNYADWDKKVEEWMAPFVKSSIYPTWLKCAAFNELYYTQFGGCFYESGLKKGYGGREFLKLHEEDHKFFVMECQVYHWANTYDVRHYNSIMFAMFWPEIERDVQICMADSTLHDPTHQVPHDVGEAITGEPYFDFDAYGSRDRQWKDLHSKFIQQCWRYYYLYKDKSFLEYVWPACKGTYGFMKSTDWDGDGLPDNHGPDQTYDTLGLYGTSLLCGGLWVGALECMEQMAIVLNDPIVSEVRDILARARKNLDSQLWYPQGNYYKIDMHSKFPTAVMADGLNGQRYCEEWGLADILPSGRMKAHLKKVFDMCVKPLKDFDGDGVGDCGAQNVKKEDGTDFGYQQSDEIWTGTTYFLAASMYRAGLKEEALKTAYGVYYLTYKEESTAYWFNTPEGWHDAGLNPRPPDDTLPKPPGKSPEQYQRPRAVWELVFEMKYQAEK